MALLTLESNQIDYLKDLPIVQFDESMSFIDIGYHIVAENENNWNEIMKTVALEELSVFATTGEEMVYEAEEVGNFFEKIKAWFKKAWASISGLFKRFIDWIGTHVKSGAAFVKSFESSARAGLKMVPADGLKFKKWYKFENVYEDNYDKDMYSKYMGKAADYKSILSQTKSGADVTAEYIKSLKENSKKYLDSVRGKLVAMPECEAKEFTKNAKEYFCGKPIEGNMKASDIDFEDTISAVKDSKEILNTAKKAYKEMKESVNKCIKNVDEMKKLCKKSDDEDAAKNNNVAYCSALISEMKSVISVYSSYNGIQLNCLRAYASQSKAVLQKLISLTGKAQSKFDKNNANNDDEDIVDVEYKEVDESATFQYESEDLFFSNALI